MKIGIIGSGYEMLPLMKFLSTTSHELHFFVDRKTWPWGDKSSGLRTERLEKAIDYLDDKVETIIVPPSLEKQAKKLVKTATVLPLFHTYLQEYVCKYSLVGKLGLLCEEADMTKETEQLIADMTSSYVLSSSQKETKNFLQPFAIWKKNLRMWTYFVSTYSRKDPMVRKTVKHDLHYFSDAGVDTLVPLSRGFLRYQKIVKSRVNRKKTRFHGLDAVQDCFEMAIASMKGSDTSYSITIHHTDTPTPLLEQKKWTSVLSAGGAVEIELIEVV